MIKVQQQLFYEDDIDPKKIRDINYKTIIQHEDTNIQRNIIHKMLLSHPEGVTDFEICILTGFSRSSVTARRNEIPEAKAIGFAKITDKNGDRLNTLWGMI